MVLEQLVISRKTKLNLNLLSYSKLNSEWITDLNIKCKNINLVRRKQKKTNSVFYLELRKEFEIRCEKHGSLDNENCNYDEMPLYPY